LVGFLELQDKLSGWCWRAPAAGRFSSPGPSRWTLFSIAHIPPTTYHIPIIPLSFQLHSRLLLVSPVFSWTFPLHGTVFRGPPLFSITFARCTVKKRVTTLPQSQCPRTECRFPGSRGSSPNSCHCPSGKRWQRDCSWGIRFAGSAISLAFGRARDRMPFPGAGSCPTLPHQGQVRGPIPKCVGISHR